MTYNLEVPIEGQTGAFGEVLGVGPILFGDIFDGAPLYYPGSTITVIERLRIVTAVVIPKFVGIDFEWFQVRRFLGSYQVYQGDFSQPLNEDYSGKLFYRNQVITAESQYTVTANPATLIGAHEQVILDNCNYFTRPELRLFPDEAEPIEGEGLYPLNPVFTGATTITRAPLVDRQFTQKIAGVGMFLKPGVEAESLYYSIDIANEI